MNAYNCRFGTRFPALSDAYDRCLVKTALETAHQLGYKDFIREGVYVAQVGPAFETPAECRFLSLVREWGGREVRMLSQLADFFIIGGSVCWSG